MLTFKTKGCVVIFALLIVLLFTISECKRGGGGGRILRTTALGKGRRNSRRPRDLHGQEMTSTQWTDPSSFSSKVKEEIVDVRQKAAINNYNDAIVETQTSSAQGDLEKKAGTYERTNKRLEFNNEDFEAWLKEYLEEDYYLFSNHIRYDDAIKNSVLLKHILGKNSSVNHSSEYDHNYELQLEPGNSPITNTVAKFLNPNPTQDYYIYSHYNNANEVQNEVNLSINMLLLCKDNVKALCAPNTVPLCTNNSEVICVIPKRQVVQCGINSHLKCVYTSSAAMYNKGRENLLKNYEGKTFYSSMKIPCVAIVTVVDEAGRQVGKHDEGTFCIVTVLIPKPKE